MKSRALAVFVSVVLLAGCGEEDFVTSVAKAVDCSIPGRNRFVRAVMQDVYLWYRELPDPDPDSFPSPDAYLAAVRYRPYDRNFSYVTSRAASDAFFAQGQFVGLGFRSVLVRADDLRILDVFETSSAAEAGLVRGARVLEINGQTVADLVAGGRLSGLLAPAAAGTGIRMKFVDRDGRERTSDLVRRAINLPSVRVRRTVAADGRRVGYVFFEHFIEPSIAELDDAFARLRAEGANELVLDVRYNGGGLVNVAQHLGGLIGGERTRGKVFVRFAHNDKNSHRDRDFEFANPPHALGVSRLAVIATDGSASASELIVNGLRPFMDVKVVGERTAGKPVGQYSFDFCDQTLFVVGFATLNSRDQGDYFDGLPADCAAPDDFGHDFGDPAEGSFAEALHVLRTGRCSTTAAAAARAQSARKPPRERQPPREGGWPVLLESY